MGHSFSVIRGAHQKSSRGAQIFKAGGTKVLSIRKQVDERPRNFASCTH